MSVLTSNKTFMLSFFRLSTCHLFYCNFSYFIHLVFNCRVFWCDIQFAQVKYLLSSTDVEKNWLVYFLGIKRCISMSGGLYAQSQTAELGTLHSHAWRSYVGLSAGRGITLSATEVWGVSVKKCAWFLLSLCRLVFWVLTQRYTILIWMIQSTDLAKLTRSVVCPGA